MHGKLCLPRDNYVIRGKSFLACTPIIHDIYSFGNRKIRSTIGVLQKYLKLYDNLSSCLFRENILQKSTYFVDNVHNSVHN